MMRIILFLATNLAILVMAAVAMTVLEALGLLPRGAYGQLFVWAALFGFGGSFLSLAMSKWLAKRAVGARVIERPANEVERWLVETVHRQAAQAGIGRPEVALYDSRDPNAFATGMSKKSSLVAVSTGLLGLMDRDEAEAVLAHEVSHIANGDMVTLTLIQGVVNTFVIFFARIIASQFDRGRFMIYIGMQIALGVLASMIVAWFSRRREFRADAGGAKLKSPHAMASALQKLRLAQESPSSLPSEVAAFGIRSSRAMKLLSTHPPLEQRIARLTGRLGG